METGVNENERTVMRDERGRWLPGTPSPSPGRPLHARHKIAERLLQDLSEVWSRRGADVLERLADTDPAKLAALAFGVLPKEALVRVQNDIDPRLKSLQQLDAAALAALGGLLDMIKRAGADGLPAEQLFPALEEDLRARLATPIDPL